MATFAADNKEDADRVQQLFDEVSNLLCKTKTNFLFTLVSYII
jgi:hypothetical protein